MVDHVLDFAIITALREEREAVCQEFEMDDSHRMVLVMLPSTVIEMFTI